jgi:Putative Flp pilus-assembly TadE/G-like
MNIRRENGQTIVVSLLFLTALLALAGAVLDVGAWYRADRQLQATADASALAAAQGLPNAARAVDLAIEYGNKNGGGVRSDNVSFSSGRTTNDTVTISASKQVPGVFTRLFGIDTVSVGARASARTSPLGSVKWISPLAINEKHPMLACTGGPCYGTQTELSYHHPGSAPKDPLTVVYVNLIADQQAKITESHIAQWIRDGFDVTTSTGSFVAFGDPTYLSPEVKAALESRFGDVVIVPVIRTFSKQRYEVISWAAFKITGLGKLSEHHWRIYGSFERIGSEGVESENPAQPNYGVSSIYLVE